MKIHIRSVFVPLSAALFIFNLQPEIVHAQGTAFSYQGQLASNGVPVSGTYNLTFSLFNAASGGSAVAGPVVTNGVAVNNGLFYVTIDFGAGVWNGQTNWLQIGVETNGAASFTTLAPRQEVLPVPYAIFAGNASNLLGTLPLGQLPAGVVTNDETASVTLDNLTLNGMLNLPATPVTINSGGSPLLRADSNGNFFSGLGAGNVTMSGGDNTGDGDHSLSANTTGNANTAIGYGALVSNTTGTWNTADGVNALLANTSGSDNTASGFNALIFNTSGSENTAIGVFALDGITTGNNNTAIGLGALEDLGGFSGVGGTNNIALGSYAGFNLNGTESYNIDIGSMGVSGESGVIRIGTPGVQTAAYIAGDLTLNGTLNLPATPVTINSGNSSLLRADNNANFFSGPYSGHLTTSGNGNTASGYEALGFNTSGNNNTAEGTLALVANLSGSGNTASGGSALGLDVSGINNTAVGYSALAGLGAFGRVGGTNNIALGYDAGFTYNSNESFNIDIGNGGVLGESGVIHIGTPGVQTTAYIAGEIFGNGGGLTNLSASQFSGTILLAQLPAAVVTNNETSSVTLDNVTLNGTLNLPAAPVTINSGGSPLLHADNNDNFFSGPDAGNLTTSGVGNTANGADALNSNTSGNYNAATGDQALYSNTFGSWNVANGVGALYSNTGGYENTANGYDALFYNTSGYQNTANGFDSLFSNTTGNGNTANGAEALLHNTTGIGNTANGIAALSANTNGFDNTANGINALYQNTSGSDNTANGADALDFNASGSDNTANGTEALWYNVSGSENTADGDYALGNLGFALSGGTNNIAVGFNAGSAFTGNESSNIDIGNFGVAGENGVIRIGTPGVQTTAYIAGQIIGDGSGLTNISASQFGAISVAQLPAAVVTNNEASIVTLNNLSLNGVLNLPEAVTIYSGTNVLLNAGNNVSFFSGPYAGNLTTTGYANTGDGQAALESITSGVCNTAVGAAALGLNANGSENTAIGFNVVSYSRSGSLNTAVGFNALEDLGGFSGVGGSNNIALGCYAGGNLTGNESYNIDIGNVGVGGESGVIRIGTPGTQTAAYIAGSLTVYGTLNLPGLPATINSGTNLLLYADTNFNFFSGPNAGNLTTSGRGNTAVGSTALQNNTSGASNTANGNAALYSNTNGSFNMADGAGALYYNRSGNFNTAIGWGAMQNIGLGNGSGGTNNIALGYNAGSALTANESSNIDIGNVGVTGESRIIRIGTPGIQTATYLSGTVYANGVALSSDRNAKEHFAAVNAQAVLSKVVALPVSEWNYKSDKQAEHIGPMAQDFHAAFGLDGADDKHISVVDEGGVALAAIQGLNEKLKTENAELRMRLDELEAQVKALSEKKQ